MEPVIVATLVGIIAYFAVIAVIPKHMLAENNAYTRSMLKQLENENVPVQVDEGSSMLREQAQSGFIARAFFALPGIDRAYPRLLKAGLVNNIEPFFLTLLLVFLFVVYGFRHFSFWAIPMALVVTCLIGWWRINRRILKRNRAFLDAFPDTLDMIVRSVRSGYPLNAAVRMVADNMQPPVSNEFKQVADETAYGSTLIEALNRMAARIDEPDVRFFVVMLAVQQEVGGNLSEVLSNLAGIIRKRKHLRMKITALTSEGRATAWVLGSLPVFVYGAIYYVQPDHLTPLYTTFMGNIVLAAAIGIVLLGVFIVRLMINMEI